MRGYIWNGLLRNLKISSGIRGNDHLTTALQPYSSRPISTIRTKFPDVFTQAILSGIAMTLLVTARLEEFLGQIILFTGVSGEYQKNMAAAAAAVSELFHQLSWRYPLMITSTPAELPV